MPEGWLALLKTRRHLSRELIDAHTELPSAADIAGLRDFPTMKC